MQFGGGAVNLTHYDACAGIGEFALAAYWAGFETIGFCESDPMCQRVIAKHGASRAERERDDRRQQNR